ncbi:hypothetical protein N0V90_013104 [Kalmusia sp. IMI 367209]|nr:hypothetical protein N0V90_013104 [Kalmusia sp. IMI 367209]
MDRHGCQNANFIAAGSIDPYTVFGVAYSTGCSAQAVTVDTSGALQSVAANLTYNGTSGVLVTFEHAATRPLLTSNLKIRHGLDLSPDNKFMYSADDMGNSVWTHSYDSTTETAQNLQRLIAPSGANPRHLAVHPNGEWVYVVYEEANSLAVYARDNESGLLTDMNSTYSLLPAGFTNTSSYWADEALFSIPSTNSSSLSPKYIITGTRSRSTSALGYVSVFALDATSGVITEQLFLGPTTASGGSANAVAPALFSEQYFAITDSGSNFVEVWKINEDGKSAAAVAHLSLGIGPANVVWLD